MVRVQRCFEFLLSQACLPKVQVEPVHLHFLGLLVQVLTCSAMLLHGQLPKTTSCAIQTPQSSPVVLSHAAAAWSGITCCLPRQAGMTLTVTLVCAHAAMTLITVGLG